VGDIQVGVGPMDVAHKLLGACPPEKFSILSLLRVVLTLEALRDSIGS